MPSFVDVNISYDLYKSMIIILNKWKMISKDELGS